MLLIGAGIMSATVGTLLKTLDPTLRIAIFERLEAVGQESSDARNNAGTGHSALCELNYTPLREDGSVDLKKAFQVMEQFELSKQLCARQHAGGAARGVTRRVDVGGDRAGPARRLFPGADEDGVMAA